MKTCLTIAFWALFPFSLLAQDFKFGSLMPEDIKLAKYDLDSFSNAAVLNEYGRAFMVYNDTKGMTEIMFEHHVRIKLFNRDGYKHAEVVIPIYKNETGEHVETISDLQAVTLNVVDGRIVSVPLDKNQVFKENVSKYRTDVKFTFPDLQEGSIVEYSYRLLSPHIFNFRTWQLQEDIPKVNSTYVAVIPSMYNYNVILRGPYPLTTNNAKVNRGGFRIAGKDIDCSQMTWGMQHIPAFVAEDYMTAASNFKSAIYFELSDIYRLNGSNIKITKDWKDVDRELTTNTDFGGQLKREQVFKDVLPAVLAGTANELDRAKAVYRYIQQHIRWNRYLGKYSENGIKNALERRSGNIGDINLALVTGLTAAGLEAEAVMLSTRDNGLVNSLHPVLSDFNYVVAKVNIGNAYYLLDASDPLLPFGLLPLHCINGQGRAVPLKRPSYWIDLVAAQPSRTQYTLSAELQPDGVLKGNLTASASGYAALHKRRELAHYNTVDEYIEMVDERWPNISITHGDIRGVDSLDQLLTEIYDIEMKLYDETGQPTLFFNPFFLNRVGKNPFNLDERTYPVDMGAAREDRVVMNIRLPDNYEVVSMPDDRNMALEDNGGRYIGQIRRDGNMLSFQQLLSLNRPTYTPEHYFSLKEFFGRIIQHEKVDVVLRKVEAR